MTHPLPMGVALIGAGMIAKTHISALSDLGDRVRLHAVVSRRPERALHLAEHYAGDTPLFTSELSDVIDNPDIQMVIVATPPSVRINLITALAKAGKHILLEKPVARNTPEACQVVEICEQSNVILGVLFQHRKRTPSIAAYDLLASGNLGKLGHVEIAAPLWRDQSYYDELDRGTYERDGGGVLITQAIHTIDLALSMTGPVATVQAMTATTPLHTMEAEDFAVAGLRFTNGAVGSLVASTASFPQSKELIALHFEQATLRVWTNRLDVAWRDRRTETRGQTDGDDAGPMIAKHEWHRCVIEDFVLAITANRPPMATGRDALATHRLIEAIETSSRLGSPVKLSD